MSRIRQQNVTAAQWSSNGEALGAIDLTLPENAAFGANVERTDWMMSSLRTMPLWANTTRPARSTTNVVGTRSIPT